MSIVLTLIYAQIAMIWTSKTPGKKLRAVVGVQPVLYKTIVEIQLSEK